MQSVQDAEVTFGQRLKLGLSLVFDAVLARRVVAGLRALDVPAPAVAVAAAPVPAPAAAPGPAAQPSPAAGLAVLSALQREGRLLDFLQQDLTGHADEEVGAAARVVHAGCRQWLRQSLDLGPALPEAEGAVITVPAGYDAQRIRLTGRVAGAPPHRGTLRHGGWVASAVRLPVVSEKLDPRVLAAAEVEIE